MLHSHFGAVGTRTVWHVHNNVHLKAMVHFISRSYDCMIFDQLLWETREYDFTVESLIACVVSCWLCLHLILI